MLTRASFFLLRALGLKHMSAPRMSVDEWHKRLADTFKVNGLVGGHLRIVDEAEDSVSNYLVTRLRGQDALLCSFQSFFIETLMLANKQISAHGWPKNAPNYRVTLAAFFILFRRFRACEILYMKGYPLDGYALMRDIKDRAFLFAGVARNITTLERILGLPVRDPSAYDKEGTKNRKDNEHRVMHAMTGKTSGLPSDVQEDLKRWDGMFHLEMHGGTHSLVQELKELQENRALQIGPSVVQDAYIMYVNRSSELGWMTTRLLPYLQVTENAFGEEWHKMREILDDSFRHMLEGFESLGKRLGASFITMMDDRFAFKQPFYYFEADGNQMPGAQVAS
jgi:hypothetical protein